MNSTLPTRATSILRRTGAAAIAITLLALSAGCAAGPAPAQPVELDEVVVPESLADVGTLGVLGDSVSLGVNSCGEPGQCAAASWASGDDPAVASVAMRIATSDRGVFPEIINSAKDGGTLADALELSGEVIAAQPDLVLLLLGGNDVCKRDVDSMTSVEDFRTDYTQLLQRISTGAPDARILALSIPDLYQLWEIGHDQIAATSVWNESPSCANLLGDAQATDAASVQRRETVAQHNADLNTVIAEVCTADVACTHDGGAVFAYQFSPQEISSIDFFHPSVTGESVIAEIAWNALAAPAS